MLCFGDQHSHDFWVKRHKGCGGRRQAVTEAEARLSPEPNFTGARALLDACLGEKDPGVWRWGWSHQGEAG